LLVSTNIPSQSSAAQWRIRSWLRVRTTLSSPVPTTTASSSAREVPDEVVRHHCHSPSASRRSEGRVAARAGGGRFDDVVLGGGLEYEPDLPAQGMYLVEVGGARAAAVRQGARVQVVLGQEFRQGRRTVQEVADPAHGRGGDDQVRRQPGTRRVIGEMDLHALLLLV
jgi:hypothetical protein